MLELASPLLTNFLGGFALNQNSGGTKRMRGSTLTRQSRSSISVSPRHCPRCSRVDEEAVWGLMACACGSGLEQMTLRWWLCLIGNLANSHLVPDCFQSSLFVG